jgi:diguanylate cyclase (GGDEF)-like protein
MRQTIQRACVVLALLGAASTCAAEGTDRDAAKTFDTAFDRALRVGLGGTPAEAVTEVQALQALVPAGDALRLWRFEAIACGAPKEDRDAAFKRAETLLAQEESNAEGDPTTRALLHVCYAAFLPQASDARPIIAAYERAVTEARTAGEPVLLGQMLATRGSGYSMAGNHAKSLIDSLEAQKFFEGDGDPLLIAVNLQNVGIAYRRMGEFERGEEYLRKSLEEPALQGLWVYQMLGHLQLGFLYDESGRPADARKELKQAIALCTENKSVADCGYARIALAGAEVSSNRPKAALATVALAKRDFEASGDPGDPSMLDFIEGQALARLGQNEEALARFDASVATWTSEENSRYLALVLPERATVLERLGEHERAVADLRRFIDAHAQDDRDRAAQRTDFMREQFDASRRDLENAQLRAQEELRKQEIEGLNEARRWQWVAVGLAVVLAGILAVVVVRQIQKARRLQLLAMTDPLTGLANRRRTDYRGSEAFKTARLTATPYSVLALDIDHFKQVNDTHGHAIGDAVLARVGRECQRTLRKLDLMGRIGGEEFSGLLPETAEPAAMHVAERLRQGVEKLNFDDLSPGLKVTISIGVAQMRDSDTDFAGLLSRADAAMYRAKQGGRNRVESDDAP